MIIRVLGITSSGNHGVAKMAVALHLLDPATELGPHEQVSLPRAGPRENNSPAPVLVYSDGHEPVASPALEPEMKADALPQPNWLFTRVELELVASPLRTKEPP